MSDLRDDGAPTPDMIAWLSEQLIQDATRWEDAASAARVLAPSRIDAAERALEQVRSLRWLAAYLSSLIADSARLKELDAQREVMYRAGPPLTEEQRRTAEDGACEMRWRGYAQKRAGAEPPSAPPHTGASNE